MATPASEAPFLFSYREEGVVLEELPGSFNPDSDVWTVSIEGELVPLALVAPERCATETITRVRTETMDED